jgi:hypothetical protein
MVNIPPLKMVIWGMVYYCFTNIAFFFSYSGGGILVPGGELKPQNFEGASYYMLHV